MDLFTKCFSEFTIEAFRLETLPIFKVGTEWEEFQRYLAGEILRNNEWTEWQDTIKKWTSEGKKILRVRVIPDKITPYIQFEINNYYWRNVDSGEEIFFIKEKEFIKRFNEVPNDFWMFDNKIVINMQYSNEGEYLGAKLLEDKSKLKVLSTIRNNSKEIGIPFTDFLAELRKKEILL